MARYQVILAYDGTDFAGFQRQRRARTVQAVVEAALRQLGWQDRAILSAGRTDAGVHASGQVIAFDLGWAHLADDLRNALNAGLPEDVAAVKVLPAAADFHPRYGASARRYRYRIFCDAVRQPLRERYAWRVWPPVEYHRLQASARLLIGTHDFAAFGTPPRPGGSTLRTVASAGWSSGDGLVFEITANAFLYHMVRRLVYLQVQAGQGRLALEDLEAGVSRHALRAEMPPGLAPPEGLELAEVIYEASERACVVSRQVVE